MSTVVIDTSRCKFKSSKVDNAFSGLTNKAISMLGGSGTVTLTDDDPAPEMAIHGNVIDVARNFSWYAGPAIGEAVNPKTGKVTHAMDKVPCAFIQEREQLLSSLVSGAMYYLDAGSKILGSSSYHKEQITSAVGAINDALGNMSSVGDQDLAIMKANNLNSLKGIYFTRETGINYRLPIYGEKQTEVKSVWDTNNSDSGSIAKGVVSGAQSVFRNVAEIINVGQPGVYIEEPKYFQGAEQGESRTITFPLANTVRRGTSSPIQQNYELLWLLAFQNKPYKTSFSRTPPPKIYNVVVPGQFSMPYAYISNMDVQFIGTTRNTKVFTPVGNPERGFSAAEVMTPVPDSYQVSLTFTSLIGSYANPMISDMFHTNINDNVISIGKP